MQTDCNARIPLTGHLHDTLTSFLIRIDALTGEDLHDAFAGEVIESGGTWVDPPLNDGATSHMIEISLHNVVGRGGSQAEAFANWRQAASRLARAIVEDDGLITVHPPFPAPRNHDEEIANVRAELKKAKANA